jgi:hypothetical protein
MKFIHINSIESLRQHWQILYQHYFANLQIESAILHYDWQQIIVKQSLFCCFDENNNLLNLVSASICHNQQAKPYWLFCDLFDGGNLLANNFLLNEIIKNMASNMKIMFCVSTKSQTMQQALAVNNFWLNHFCFSYGL